MKKLTLSLGVIFSFILFSLFGRESRPALPPVNPVPDPSPLPSVVPVNSATPAIPQTSSGFKNGSYTGDVADAFYGNLQVQAIISGGRITDVRFLQFPNDRERSVMINTRAMPYLKAETIQAQSAQVDIVSGATDTSLAFIQSLGSALNQAR